MVSVVVEVFLSYFLFKVGVELVCFLSNYEGDVENIFWVCCEDVLFIVLYVLEFDVLIEKVRLIKGINVIIFNFVCYWVWKVGNYI